MARPSNFAGTVTFTRKHLAGITLLGSRDTRKELSLDEMMDELEKDEIRGTRKEILLSKIRERAPGARLGAVAPQAAAKRYIVDPETGKVDVDEEGGEYTYKDALLISASIKGKGGHYDEFIKLIHAIKEAGGNDPPKPEMRPKEYYVEQNTGVIVKDAENGDLTLSEARTISQSLKKADPGDPPTSYSVDAEGELHEVKPGAPLVVKKIVREPSKTYVLNAEGEPVEQEAGKPIVIKVQSTPSPNTSFAPFPAMSADGQPIKDSGGRQVYVDVEPQMKWMGFQSDQRRAEERHGALMGLFKTVRENFSDGISSVKLAAEEIRRARSSAQGSPAQGPPAPAPPAQAPEVQEQRNFSCGNCHTVFAAPADWAGQDLKCPGCERVYTKGELA